MPIIEDTEVSQQRKKGQRLFSINCSSYCSQGQCSRCSQPLQLTSGHMSMASHCHRGTRWMFTIHICPLRNRIELFAYSFMYNIVHNTHSFPTDDFAVSLFLLWVYLLSLLPDAYHLHLYQEDAWLFLLWIDQTKSSSWWPLANSQSAYLVGNWNYRIFQIVMYLNQ